MKVYVPISKYQLTSEVANEGRAGSRLQEVLFSTPEHNL